VDASVGKSPGLWQTGSTWCRSTRSSWFCSILVHIGQIWSYFLADDRTGKLIVNDHLYWYSNSNLLLFNRVWSQVSRCTALYRLTSYVNRWLRLFHCGDRTHRGLPAVDYNWFRGSTCRPRTKARKFLYSCPSRIWILLAIHRNVGLAHLLRCLLP
jgi:hypothetical protein